MGWQEASSQYAAALKQGRKAYKEALVQGRYPYPQVLDEIISESMVAGQLELGVMEIPSSQIIGTKTAGRRSAFSADFLPLMDQDTEFAGKWIALCEAHLGDEGIRDPIRCYEYFGRFYVQEGNKRVSVLRSYDAPTIPAFVIRMIPVWSEDPAVLAYYDFMESFPKTRLYRARFSRAGSFSKLQKALGHEPDHVWTEDERRCFLAGYAYFQEPFLKLGGGDLPITAADAMLVWLKVYSFGDLMNFSSSELAKSVKAVWSDVKALSAPIAVRTDAPAEAKENSRRIFKHKRPSHVNAAFISDQLPEQSDWARAHDLGREYLETVLEGRVTTQTFYGVHPYKEAEAAMEAAIENGARMIFAMTPPLIGACRKTAARHPEVRILNCSVSMPYAGVRTYYSRIYEAKYIAGAIAGALSRDGRIGYVASNPIFGVPASINAFALGAQLTNPHVEITLRWSCVEEGAMDALAREGITLISNRDIPTPDRIREPWGLCRVEEGGKLRSLASPYWHWGSVYTKLVQGVLGGGWEALAAPEGQPVNYWWGMNSRAVDILVSDELPAGIRQLAGILRKGVIDGSIQPFPDATPEKILYMDTLPDCVHGSIPAYGELLPMSRSLVRLQGVYRDAIPPEKEDPIL